MADTQQFLTPLHLLRDARNIMLQLSDSEDSTGCSGDLTVVNKPLFDELHGILVGDICATMVESLARADSRSVRVRQGVARYVVDGHEFKNRESSLIGDGQFPPFMVFDVDAQDYVGGEYPTRAAAQTAADRLNSQKDDTLHPAAVAERERIIALLATTEFTSLDHMPHEAATIIRGA